jgi:hypothetical protein
MEQLDDNIDDNSARMYTVNMSNMLTTMWTSDGPSRLKPSPAFPVERRACLWRR